MPSSSDSQPVPPPRPNAAEAVVKTTRKPPKAKVVVFAVDDQAWDIDAEPSLATYTSYLANVARYGRPMARQIMLAEYVGPDVMLALNQHADEAETRAVFAEAERRFEEFGRRVDAGEVTPSRASDIPRQRA